MTLDTHRSSSGLVFLGTRDIDIVATCNSVGNALEASDYRVTGLRVASDSAASVMAAGFAVGLTFEPEPAGPPLPGNAHVLQIQVNANFSSLAPDPATAEVILAAVTRHLALGLAPDQVRWLAPDAVIDTNAFLDAFTVVRPRRVRAARSRHARPALPRPVAIAPALAGAALPAPHAVACPPAFAAVEDSFEQIAIRASAQACPDPLRAVFLTDPSLPDDATGDTLANPATSSALRLAAWIMAITVGLFALPLAAALVVLNMLRGEDLRRAAQAMALTGTFLSLNSTGATAQTLSALTGLVG